MSFGAGSQRRSARKNIEMIHCAGVNPRRRFTVRVTQYLTRAHDVPAYAAVEDRDLGAARPSSMLWCWMP